MESLVIVVITIIAFAAPLIYTLMRKSRKTCKNRVPPEPAGSWPIIGHLHLLSGSQPPHIMLGNLADKYGPIFTIKLGVHKTLVISNAEIAKECLTTNDRAFANRPKSLAMEILGYDYSMIGFSPYGEYWRQIRKITTLELLSKHRLEMRKHVREIEVKAAITGLYQEWIKSRDDSKKLCVEMKKWFFDVTLNVILKIIVGKRFVEYTDDDRELQDSWKDVFREYLELSGKVAVSDALPYLRWLDLDGVEKEMKKSVEKIDCVLGKWLQERKEKKDSGRVPEGEEDFMDLLLSILNDAEEFSGRDADTINKATCLTLILAASDTTTITLTWTLCLLLNNREVLKKAQRELDIHVGKERQVTESDTQVLVYLQAIIKESFRLYPALPLLIPHEAMEECTVESYHIPVGTRLIINTSKIHKDPCVWQYPEKFQPERFLTSHNKDVDFRGQNFKLIPFGSGRRMCPGISFALQILNLTLATLIHSFEIENPSDGPIDMSGSAGMLTNVINSPVEVVLTPRLPAHLY